MNAYFFVVAASSTGVVAGKDRYGNASNSIQSWDSCTPKIVFGSSPDETRERCESEYNKWAETQTDCQTTVHKTTVTPFVDKLITESGNLPLDWPGIMKKMEASMESVPVDDFEQGYWVDVDSAVRPEKLSFSVGTLQSDLPEDIRTGLNWAADRQFFFLFSILCPPPAPPPPDDLAEMANPALVEPIAGESRSMSLEDLYATFPGAFDKAAVVLIQARNSVVAAWLWRRYAAGTPYTANAIRIEPWPGTADPSNAE